MVEKMTPEMEMSRAIDIGYQFADKYDGDGRECIDGIVYCPNVTFNEVARAFKVLIGAQVK